MSEVTTIALIIGLGALFLVVTLVGLGNIL